MNITPRGCSSIGGELARVMEDCRERAMKFFMSYGYSPFNPAEFQLLGEAIKNLHRRRGERLIVVNSPFGEPCCLRADITLSALSYMALHHAPDEFPLRLCYAERVFSAPLAPKENLEDTQIGVELIGWEGLGSDIEITSLLLRSLGSLGLEGSSVVLGDVSIASGLFSSLPKEAAERIVDCLQEMDYCGYESALDNAGISGHDREALSELPLLKGTPDILDRAESIFKSREPFKPLREITAALEKLGCGDRIRIDLGFIRDLGYYSGPVFNVYSPSGALLGGGGRYAYTLADTRFSCQAVGFGVSLRELAQNSSRLSNHKTGTNVMIWSGSSPADKTIAFAEKLTKTQIPFEISWSPNKEASKKLALARGCVWWMNMEDETVIELSSGKIVPASIFSKSTRNAWADSELR
ncbi:ATP phosphoribosyltransferase regulatory subunit [Synergistales bacterium]|nr:ATP phosphoribosyltransferase regulatory subunit [Synergistales bacterium]